MSTKDATICLLKVYRPKTDANLKQWVCNSQHYFTLLNIDNARKTIMLYYNLNKKPFFTDVHINLIVAIDYDVAKPILMQYCK